MSARSVLYISQGATERGRAWLCHLLWFFGFNVVVGVVDVVTVGRSLVWPGKPVGRSFIQNSLDFIHENAFIMQ